MSEQATTQRVVDSKDRKLGRVKNQEERLKGQSTRKKGKGVDSPTEPCGKGSQETTV